MLQIKGKVNTAICFARVIEDEAVEQIRRMCDTEMTRGSQIRIMPDVHAGKDNFTDEEIRTFLYYVEQQSNVKNGKCRYDGLCNVPIDDEAEFDRWFHKKGDYYEHNGSHPYEIRPSGSIRYSIHLIPRKYEESENRWYLALSGDAYVTSIETIKMFIGMKDAGIPVELGDAEWIAARLTETDTIGILPEIVPSFAA